MVIIIVADGILLALARNVLGLVDRNSLDFLKEAGIMEGEDVLPSLDCS